MKRLSLPLSDKEQEWTTRLLDFLNYDAAAATSAKADRVWIAFDDSHSHGRHKVNITVDAVAGGHVGIAGHIAANIVKEFNSRDRPKTITVEFD